MGWTQHARSTESAGHAECRSAASSRGAKVQCRKRPGQRFSGVAQPLRHTVRTSSVGSAHQALRLGSRPDETVSDAEAWQLRPALALDSARSGCRQLAGVPLEGPKIVHDLSVAGPNQPDGLWRADASPSWVACSSRLSALRVCRQMQPGQVLGCLASDPGRVVGYRPLQLRAARPVQNLALASGLSRWHCATRREHHLLARTSDSEVRPSCAPAPPHRWSRSRCCPAPVQHTPHVSRPSQSLQALRVPRQPAAWLLTRQMAAAS